MPFSWKERQKSLESVASQGPELLVLGGGVVGCSLAAHAAEMGLNTLLVERRDLAWGASGNSTGLAHAGLRYLAQGRFWYVLHESRERDRLEVIAPHWVRPFNFVLPVYRGDPYPFPIVRLGNAIYDFFGWLNSALSHRPAKRRHQRLSAQEALDRLPGLQPEGLRGATEYFVDAQLQDSRFTLGWAQKAARHGARVVTYCDVGGLDMTKVDLPQTLLARDSRNDREYPFTVPLVINATGGWIDTVRGSADLEKPLVRPSRGIHLIVDQVATTPLIFAVEPKGRVFFIIPLGQDASLVGTTDTPLQGSPDQSFPNEREVQDLVRRLFQFFPYLKQGEHLLQAIDLYKQVHVRSTSWGLRPLLNQPGDTLLASREHRLIKETPAFWSLPGVKLTAARAAGLEAAQAAWKVLRKERVPKLGLTPLPGGEMENYEQFLAEALKRFKLGDNSDDIIAQLVALYGTRYLEVLSRADDEPHYRERIMPEQPWIPAQAAHAVEEEMVLTLNDFLWRRTKWGHLQEIPETQLHKIISAMAEFMHWGPNEVEREIAQYHEERRRHRVC